MANEERASNDRGASQPEGSYQAEEAICEPLAGREDIVQDGDTDEADDGGTADE